jgi:hypothetical protein
VSLPNDTTTQPKCALITYKQAISVCSARNGHELIYRQLMLPIALSWCLLSNSAAIAFGGVAGDALESIAEGTLRGVAERAREDRNRNVLLTQRPFSESHAPLRQIGQWSEPGGCLEV